MSTIGVLTSGGDAPGMNAAIRAIVKTAICNNIKVLGIKEGYKGLLAGNIQEMTSSCVAEIIQKGGTILRSARCKEFMTDEGFKDALNNIYKYNMSSIVILGGDGSFRGGQKLSKAGVPVICIPCTIDNDIGGYSDYSIGFSTALETIGNAIIRLKDTSTSHGRANVVEVMGRNCGDLAIYAGIAGGIGNILTPEIGYDLDDICQKIKEDRDKGKQYHIILVTEGIYKGTDENSYKIASIIESKTGIETKVTILGHIQRGGSPSSIDRIIGSQMGYMAVKLSLNNKKNIALGYRNNKIIFEDLDTALSSKKKPRNGLLDMIKTFSI